MFLFFSRGDSLTQVGHQFSLIPILAVVCELLFRTVHLITTTGSKRTDNCVFHSFYCFLFFPVLTTRLDSTLMFWPINGFRMAQLAAEGIVKNKTERQQEKKYEKPHTTVRLIKTMKSSRPSSSTQRIRKKKTRKGGFQLGKIPESHQVYNHTTLLKLLIMKKSAGVPNTAL